MKLKSVMNESKKQSTHAIIENCMVKKLIEYESEILKTCTKVTAS